MVEIILAGLLLIFLAIITVISLVLSTYKYELWELWIEKVCKRGRK